MKRWHIIGFTLLLAGALLAQVRVKDLARLQGIESEQIVGYGLVTGLNGTGDTRRVAFTIQSVLNMLQRFGLNVPRQYIRMRNVAAVMVTAEVPAYVQKGDRLTVTVSSIGDARSLEGGVLLLTPLVNSRGEVVAMAQGALSVGGFSVPTTGGGGVRQNHTLTGRIPNGGVVQISRDLPFVLGDTLLYALTNKDLTTAQRMAEAVNQRFGEGTARPVNPYTVQVVVPPDYRDRETRFAFLSEVEQLELVPDVPARVVINERTGTVVVGGNVKILPAAVAHGNLSVEIRSEPIISQPAPFSQGQTVVLPNTQATVYQDEGRMVTIENATTVQEVTQALNSLGVMPRDIIAILQALKAVGALQAELIVM